MSTTTEFKDDVRSAVAEVLSANLSQLVEQVAEQVALRLQPLGNAEAAEPDPLLTAAHTQLVQLTRQREDVEAGLVEIRDQVAKAQNDLDERAAELRKMDRQLDTLKDEIASAELRMSEAVRNRREIEVELEDLRQNADAVRGKIEKLTAELLSLETNLADARALLAQAESIERKRSEVEQRLAQLEAQRAEFDVCKRAGEGAHRLLERLWPAWLRDGALAEWKTRLETGVFDAAAPTAFGLLFAAVHTYTAALRDSDPKTLHDSLRDLGRRLYTWLRELGQSDADAARVAEQWAVAINADCAGRGEVDVPIPGNAANNQWMIFQPRGGSSPDVASVRSWCVRDAQKRPIHRAEVSV